MNKKVLKEYINSKDETFKKDLEPVINKWLESEEIDEKTKAKVEEAKPKTEEPKQEAKETVEAEQPKKEVAEKAQPKEEPKVEEQKEVKQEDNRLEEALELLKAQGEELKSLKETIDKNESFGYSPKPKQGKEESSVEDTAKKMENLR